jgi:hypothetical protein
MSLSESRASFSFARTCMWAQLRGVSIAKVVVVGQGPSALPPSVWPLLDPPSHLPATETSGLDGIHVPAPFTPRSLGAPPGWNEAVRGLIARAETMMVMRGS